MIKRICLMFVILGLAACDPVKEVEEVSQVLVEQPAAPATSPPQGSINVIDCLHVNLSGSFFEPGTEVQLSYGPSPPLGQIAAADGTFSFDMSRGEGIYGTVARIAQPQSGYDLSLDLPACV